MIGSCASLQVASLAVGLTLLAGAGAPLAAQQAHMGGRTGVRVDTDDLFVGAHLTAPLARRVDLYPSFDIFFPDRGSMIGINGDVRLRLPTGSNVQFFTGTGLAVTRRSVDGRGHSDLGANLLGGLETRSGRVHPFVESRLRFSDRTVFQLAGGFNIALGGSRAAFRRR
jgi:hypothetical protein